VDTPRSLAVVLALSLSLAGLAASPALASPDKKTDNSCTTANVRLQGVSSSAPSNLCIPAASADDTSLLLVWNKPEGGSLQVVDYRVYMDGALLGSSRENARQNSPAQQYIDSFYTRDTDGFHVKTLAHAFKVTALRQNSIHEFSVRAVYADGSLSAPSATITQRMASPTHRSVVTDPQFGAVGDGTTLNTPAIQKAIDDCSTPNCTVVVPSGTFLTGALFLHSNMTLDLEPGARLLGSDRWQDYPLEKGYYLYGIPDPVPTDASYTAYLRPPSLINVIPKDNGRTEASRVPGAGATNVRIVGTGTIDGNGWKRTSPGSIVDETGASLPQYVASSASKVATDGILAASQVTHARENPGDLVGIVNPPATISDSSLYGQYRSSLMTFVGVKNLYLEGLSAENPAFHGVMFLDSANVTVYGTRHTTFNTNNGDGLEFGGTSNGIVVNNFFDTGDDVVNFAAGQGVYGAQGRPSSDVWIAGNYLRKGHGGVAIGSHTAAWVENILAEDNVMYTTETGGLRMKSTSDMAGGARNITFRDTAMACLATNAFIASLAYSQSPSGYVPAGSATFTDITVSNVSVDGNNTTTCAMPTSTKNPVILVEAGPGVSSSTSTVSRFSFDHVRFRNVNPTSIQGLVSSQFTDVCFASVLGNVNPWKLDAYSTGNTFVRVSPPPGTSKPTGSCTQ
jgi:exo-poly-alpha-galacturonosidase